MAAIQFPLTSWNPIPPHMNSIQLSSWFSSDDDDVPNSKRSRWFARLDCNATETCLTTNVNLIPTQGLAKFLCGDQGYPNIGVNIAQFLDLSGFMSMWQTCRQTKLLLERASSLNWQFSSSKNAVVAWYTFREHVAFLFSRSLFQVLLLQANQLGPKLCSRLCHDFSHVQHNMWTELTTKLFQLGNLQAFVIVDHHHPIDFLRFFALITPDKYPLQITDEFVYWASLRFKQKWGNKNGPKCACTLWVILFCIRNGSKYAFRVAQCLYSDQLKAMIRNCMDNRNDVPPFLPRLYYLALKGANVRPFALEIAAMYYPLDQFLTIPQFCQDVAFQECMHAFIVNHKWHLLPAQVLVSLQENNGILPLIKWAAQVNYVLMVAKYKNYGSKWANDRHDNKYLYEDTWDHWFFLAFVRGHVEVCEELTDIKSYVHDAPHGTGSVEGNDHPCCPAEAKESQVALRLLNAYWQFQPEFHWEEINVPRIQFSFDMSQAIQEYINNGRWEQFPLKIRQFLEETNL
jgi:hypothetical protein